ncbi:MAG: SUMF1/EgtB/PvdO family nonheme iron enzyme [Planctomycetota bacterium]|jgi:formylglycine-generating enzyme required for sulfatase activity
MKQTRLLTVLVVLVTMAVAATAADIPKDKEYTNSIGMKFVRIEPGTFKMGGGQTGLLPFEILPHTGGRGDRMDTLRPGDFDEKPVHTVKITKPFYMAVFEVTNFQYEMFDYTHKMVRGKQEGISKEDDEAVIFVNWYEAKTFCEWLSRKEGLSYRLPTEAEWEYACRAGTTTNYYAGDILPPGFRKANFGAYSGTRGRSLKVGQTPANAWGLYDMHGNVEEWCQDWYGPYKACKQTDPVGYADGNIRVTRGGSHGNQVYGLRSANRLGTVPEDKHDLIGFRLVIGELPTTKPLPVPPPALHQQNVVERCLKEISKGPDPDKPYFKGPRKYVKIPRHMEGPLYASHNHSPDIIACPNGDLLTLWFSCVSERDREMTVAASRLRYGQEQWDPASLFWDAPDRNEVGSGLRSDEKGNIYSAVSLSKGSGYGQSAKVLRVSTDSGATWSRPTLRGAERIRGGGYPGDVAFKLKDGTLVANAFTRLKMSRDNGLSWYNPGGVIRGGHVCVTQLKDGRFFVLTRGEEVEGMMATSISDDFGKSYTYSASPFPAIEGGQSSTLLRLREGPLFFGSFADWGIEITDASGTKREVRGLFAAVSTDEGKTWPYMRLITDDGPGRPVESTNGGLFTMSAGNSEYQGYTNGCQTADGLIHIISSRQHFTFNLKWLMTPAPAPRYPLVKVKRIKETFTGPDFDAKGWGEYRNYQGGFTGKGTYHIDSTGRLNGLNRIVGKGSFEAIMAFDNLQFNPPAGSTYPGVLLRLRDARIRNLFYYIGPDQLQIISLDRQHEKGNYERGTESAVKLEKAPKSAKVKFVWTESDRRLRVFYGLNGAEPVTEMPYSAVKEEPKDATAAAPTGLFYGRPFGETTAIYLMAENGACDILK